MTALELISLANQVLFVGLFVAVAVHSVRRPTRANFDTLLLFASVATVVIIARVADWLALEDRVWLTVTILVILNLAPLAMLRLVDDFSGTPRWIQLAGAAAFVFVSTLAITSFTTAEQAVEIATIGFFLAVGGYAALAFARESRRTRGITRRRMGAVAAGAILFITAIVLVFAAVLVPPLGDALGAAGQMAALAAVVFFFLGFVPPAGIRRAWREPDLRRFLEQSIHIAAMPDERAALAELQHAAAAALGATGASIGIADEARGVLRYLGADGRWEEYPEDAFIAGRAFRDQRRIVAVDAMEEDPDHAPLYQDAGARTVIAAPITSEDRRIGVLAVFADRAPIFVEDDLWLLELLANQSGVLIEVRTLTAQASELRAREDATRLKEEFLSAAAHDLRTPLTVVLGQAELLERRFQRNPSAPADPEGVARMAREARRLRDLVSELLDAQRLEQGGALLELTPADLCEIVEGARRRHAEQGLSVSLERPEGPIVGAVDRPRIEQVVDNLIENALKYTAPGDELQLRIDRREEEARISIIDHGIGIPVADRPRVFERFFRASNVQSITDTGLGLGLYICRRIIEQHGGRIWFEPTPGGGSTFNVALPLGTVSSEPRAVPERAPWPATQGNEAVADA